MEKLYQFRRGMREVQIYLINSNVMLLLLAVSSAHDTVHIFKLGSQKLSTLQGSSSSKVDNQPSSPPGSIDSREGVQDLDGGYEAFI
jgi:autophagy-related protein 18